MPKTYVENSVTINTSTEKVKRIVGDFNSWSHWSPWLILEPEAKVTVSEGGKKQEWEGKRIGSGEMTILEEKEDVIHYDLLFLKPWKSKAKVDFLIQPKGENSTTVTWTMDSSLPFFMFWMKNTMEKMIGMDYDRGLLMLKDYVEKGQVDARLEFLGESEYAGCNYVGLKSECSFDEIGKVMDNDVARLNAFSDEYKEILTNDFFSIYHKFDFGKNKIVYTIGIGVKEKQENLPEGMFIGVLPATKLYSVRHIGPYELTGNAWSAIMSMDRAKEFAKNKKIPPMEFYRNNPHETEPKDLITDVCMPLK